MKPFEHNGRQFSNADAWRTARATQAPMAQAPGAPGEEGKPEEPEAVVQQHGPAMHVDIEHEHEMGTHHVHSVHADGHEHHSDHGSAEEAHDHGKRLASPHEGETKTEPEEKDEWDEE